MPLPTTGQEEPQTDIASFFSDTELELLVLGCAYSAELVELISNLNSGEIKEEDLTEEQKALFQGKSWTDIALEMNRELEHHMIPPYHMFYEMKTQAETAEARAVFVSINKLLNSVAEHDRDILHKFHTQENYLQLLLHYRPKSGSGLAYWDSNWEQYSLPHIRINYDSAGNYTSIQLTPAHDESTVIGLTEVNIYADGSITGARTALNEKQLVALAEQLEVMTNELPHRVDLAEQLKKAIAKKGEA